MQQNRNYQVLIVITFLLLLSLACGLIPTEQLQETNEVPSSQEVEETSTDNVVFTRPEDVINYYFEGVIQADTDKIIAACAINEMGENFRFDLFTERVGYLTFTTLSPTDYPLYVELNKAQLTQEILNRVKFFAYSLLSEEETYTGKTILMDVERTNKFMREVNPEKLTEIEIQKIELSNKSLMSESRYIENATKIANIYGADESTERVVLFIFDNNYYYVGFSLLRYGENWKISSQVSPMANTIALGAAQEITVEEFEAMINGD